MKVRNLFTVVALSALVSCSAIAPAVLGALGNRGTSVDAQVGQNNTKQIVGSQTTITARDGSQVDVSRPKVRSDNVGQVTVNEIDYGILLFALLGWLLPSPGELWRKAKDSFRKKFLTKNEKGV